MQYTAYFGRCVTVEVALTPIMSTAAVVRFCRLQRLSREAACHCAHTPEHDATLEEINSLLQRLYEGRNKNVLITRDGVQNLPICLSDLLGGVHARLLTYTGVKLSLWSVQSSVCLQQ